MYNICAKQIPYNFFYFAFTSYTYSQLTRFLSQTPIKDRLFVHFLKLVYICSLLKFKIHKFTPQTAEIKRMKVDFYVLTTLMFL